MVELDNEGLVQASTRRIEQATLTMFDTALDADYSDPDVVIATLLSDLWNDSDHLRARPAREPSGRDARAAGGHVPGLFGEGEACGCGPSSGAVFAEISDVGLSLITSEVGQYQTPGLSSRTRFRLIAEGCASAWTTLRFELARRRRR